MIIFGFWHYFTNRIVFQDFCFLSEILCLTTLQLKPISIGDDILDLVVIGCGPAGLALAAEAAKLGIKVGLIGPDLPFTNNYGVWEDEFKGTSFGPLFLLYCFSIRYMTFSFNFY